MASNELIHELKNNPERFSPNVILELYQEKILPNLAYIGGSKYHTGSN